MSRMKNPIKIILLGLIGITAAILQNLLTLRPIDMADNMIRFSIITFAIALPLLSFSFLIREQIYNKRRVKTYISIRLITICGILVDLAGITTAFWHVLQWAGVAFLVSGFITFWIYIHALSRLKKDGSLEMEQDEEVPPAPSGESALQKVEKN